MKKASSQKLLADLSPANVRWRSWELLQNLHCNVVEEPLEAATLVPLLKRRLLAYITNWIATNSRLTSVKVFSVLRIKPHLNNSHVVLKQQISIEHIRFSQHVRKIHLLSFETRKFKLTLNDGKKI